MMNKEELEEQQKRWKLGDEQKAFCAANKLKLWNGPGYDPKGQFHHVSICAKTQKRAIELLNECGITTSASNFSQYFAKCWGIQMAYVKPEEGVWAEITKNKSIRRIK